MEAYQQSKKQSEAQALQWTLSFAQGYLELGMFAEAERELAKLPLKMRCHSDPLEMRVRLLLHQGHYESAAALARSSAKIYPGVAEFYSHALTAYEELGRLEEARSVWLSAPSLFHLSGIFHFKLARLEAKLGNGVEACQHMALAIELDPAMQTRAAGDPQMNVFLEEANLAVARAHASELADSL